MVLFPVIFLYRKKSYFSPYYCVFLNKCHILGHIFERFFARFLIKVGYVYIGYPVHMKVIRSMLYDNSEFILGFLDDIVLLSGGCLADIVEYF